MHAKKIERNTFSFCLALLLSAEGAEHAVGLLLNNYRGDHLLVFYLFLLFPNSLLCPATPFKKELKKQEDKKW